MTWTSCSKPPPRHDTFEVERRFITGEQLEPPEPMEWRGEWINKAGLDVSEWDVWREMGGGE
jgi:hypothetical protein